MTRVYRCTRNNGVRVRRKNDIAARNHKRYMSIRDYDIPDMSKHLEYARSLKINGKSLCEYLLEDL